MGDRDLGKLFGGAALAAIAFSSTAARAQDQAPAVPAASDQSEQGLADIVVTAQRRTERSQDVPIALSAFTSADIREQRIQNVVDLSSLAPSLRITSADAASNPKIFVRGVGLDDASPTASSGVGMYVDGVYVGSLIAQLAGFYDLAQIEVLRGPQGTLFGRNSTGGAINITTQQPTFDPKATFSLDAGSFKRVNASAGFGGPIIDGVLAYRIAATVTRDDGNTYNRFDGRHVNSQQRYATRGTLLFTPGPDTQITLSGSAFWNRGDTRQSKSRGLIPATAAATGADGLCKPAFYYTAQCTDAVGYAETSSNPYSLSANIEPADKITQYAGYATINQNFGDVKLVSITAYSKVARDANENTDSNPLQELEIYRVSSQRQFTQELRLQGKTGPLTWVAGGFYEHEIVRNTTGNDILRLLRPLFIAPDNPTGVSPENSVGYFTYPSVQKTDSYAVFGQVDYAVTDQLVATGGLRWSADKKTFEYQALVDGSPLFSYADSRTFSGLSGRAGLRFQIQPSWNVYATYNHGYKSGGYFSDSATDPSQLLPVRNETVDAYEIGSKLELFGHRLRLNGSAFYYNYSDIQVFANVLRNGLTVQALTNAASAKIYGGELEATVQPVKNFVLTASAAYLHATYGTFVSADGAVYTGNQMSHAPRWTLTGGAHYKHVFGDGTSLTPRVDMSYRTRDYFDPTQRLRVSDGDAFLLNGEIALSPRGDRFEFGVWGKNLTNHTYLLAVTPIDGLGYDIMTYGEQRTLGGFLRFHY